MVEISERIRQQLGIGQDHPEAAVAADTSLAGDDEPISLDG